jgi:putative sterol carrier protein
MFEWWPDISGLNQAFYIAAAFFSCVFLWQFIASMIGLAGGDMDFDADIDADAIESMSAFKMLSLRAILAFCTLFSWAAAMYIEPKGLPTALLFALAWGLAGWLVVTLIVHWMRKLAETGNARLSTCVGTNGTVYLNIPEGSMGEVRVMVSGRITLVKARAAGDTEMKAGAPIHVTRMIDNTTVEVEEAASQTPVPCNRDNVGS